MVHPLANHPPFPACPGKTIFEVLDDRWPDREFMGELREILHQRELDRAANPPALHVTVVSDTEPPGEYRVDPDTRTVSVTVTGPMPVTGSQETQALPAFVPETGNESPG